MVENRRTDPTPVSCHRCGWIGTVSDCIHTYTSYGGYGGYGVSPIDACPVCESTELEDRPDELAVV